MALQYKIIAIGAYPQYKKIYRTAMQKVEEYGGSSYEPVLGGKTIEAIKTIFGWRAAKAFSTLIHKII